jgi:fluoride ion exporter CrcB/FEX
MPAYLAVAVGGAFGAVARFGIDRSIERRESLDLLREGQAGVATLYAAGSVLTGILAVYAGTLVGRTL